MNLSEKWAVLSILTKFFDDPAEAVDLLPRIPALKKRFEGILPELNEGSLPQDLKYTYDDLFKGTSADIYIPLWASCCVNEAGCLLDQTTLDVIRTYHRFGYVPKVMDGNPPDYIGQQFRFLCYLTACSVWIRKEKQAVPASGAGPEDPAFRSCRTGIYEKAFAEFVSDFTLDTVRTAAEGILNNTDLPFFTETARLMLDLFTGEDIFKTAVSAPAEDAKGSADNAESFVKNTGISTPDSLCGQGPVSIFECAEVLKEGPGAPIPDEEPHIVMTSGRNNCGGKCPAKAVVCEGCVLDVSADCGIGDPAVHTCLRGASYRQTYMNGRRLRYPMIRRGKRGEGLFRRISMKEAADHTEKELRRLTDQYGPGCRYDNYASGVTGMMRPSLMANRFLALTGGYLSFYGSYSSVNTETATTYTYGTFFSGNSPEDLYNTAYLILWAHNPVTTIFGSQLRTILTDLKTRGTKIVVIDPRRSDTAIALADEWIQIIPSTDGAMADAMAYTIWSEGLQDQKFMDTFCSGFDKEHMPEGVPAELNYHDYLFGLNDGIVKTPEWAEKITGVPADTIRRLAIEYSSAKPACLLAGLGNQRTGNGEQTARGMIALACMTGNVGIPGGGAAGCGMAVEEPMPVFPTGTNPYKGVISCYLWPKAIKEGHDMTLEKDHIRGMERLSSDLKFMFNIAGNTLVNQHSDVNGTMALLRDETKCECIVASDVFMTPSMKFADVVLPAPSFLEEDDINAPWRYGHYLLAQNAAVKPVFGCVYEYDFIAELAERFDVFEEWSEGCTGRASHFRLTYDRFKEDNPSLGLPPLEEFMKGGYNYKGRSAYIAFAEQIRDPEHNRFDTPTGKIEIVSGPLYALHDPLIPAYPGYTPCREGPADPLREKYPLQLIGFHTKRRCHSTHDNNILLEEADPQLLWISPADAADRGLKDGDMVRIRNDRGSIRIRCKVTERVDKGVAALSQGAWYTPDKSASAGENGLPWPDDIRGNINTVTGFYPTPLAKGNPQHTNLVEVEKY